MLQTMRQLALSEWLTAQPPHHSPPFLYVIKLCIIMYYYYYVLLTFFITVICLFQRWSQPPVWRSHWHTHDWVICQWICQTCQQETSGRGSLASSKVIGLAVVDLVKGERKLPAFNPTGGKHQFPADFLVSKEGKILAVKYGKDTADQWSVKELFDLAKTLNSENETK